MSASIPAPAPKASPPSADEPNPPTPAPQVRRKRRRLSFANLLYIYRSRLRSRNVLVQDAFAILGIAVGVSLLFASQVASTSLTHSVQKLSAQLVGNTQYQLDARGPAGVSEHLLSEVRRIPGVKLALPVLDQQAQVIGPNGQTQSVDLIGTDPRFADFGGSLLRRFSAKQLAAQRAIALPLPIAKALGVGALQTMTMQVGAKVVPTLLGTTLGAEDIGNLVNSPVALAPVGYAQQLTGMTGRITRIFVQVAHGRNNEVRDGLNRLASVAHVNVEPADWDAKLFSVAALPENQGETLFSIISATVGFLLAANAMLITVPRRRRLLNHLRHQGATHRISLQLLLFDAAILGVIACALGLVARRSALDQRVSPDPRLLVICVPGWVGADRVVAVRRGGNRGRHGCGVRWSALAVARHIPARHMEGCARPSVACDRPCRAWRRSFHLHDGDSARPSGRVKSRQHHASDRALVCPAVSIRRGNHGLRPFAADFQQPFAPRGTHSVAGTQDSCSIARDHRDCRGGLLWRRLNSGGAAQPTTWPRCLGKRPRLGRGHMGDAPRRIKCSSDDTLF